MKRSNSRGALLVHAAVAATACASLVGSVGCAADPATHRTPVQRLVADAPNATDVEVGRSFAAEMPLNAGTGYVWSASGFDAGIVTLESRESRSDARTTPGAKPPTVGGRMLERFAFRAKAPGETEIRFELRRPWERDVSPADVRTMRVTVRSPAPR